MAPSNSQLTKAATKDIQPAQVTLGDYLDARKDALAAVLPKHLTVDRLIKLAVLATRKTPALAKCSMASLYLALMQCAELGLEPTGTLGGAYLIPYGDNCTLIIGYRGMIDLARRSGVLSQIEAHVVHERDLFELEFGLTPKLRHVPAMEGNPGAPRLAYMVARLKDGGVHTEVMTIEEVNRIRDRSRSGKAGPWVTDYEEMVKKTVVRRGWKYLPVSSEMRDALEGEEEREIYSPSPAFSIADGAPMLPADTTTSANAPIATSKVKDAVRVATAKKTAPAVVDVVEGESEEAAWARANGEPPPDMVLPTGNEPPPPTDADAP